MFAGALFVLCTITRPVQKQSSYTPDGLEIITMEAESVLACLQKYLPKNPVIVEAGAFNGDDTKKMSFLWPLAHIFAFEPVPENFERCQKNVGAHLNVNLFPVALSDQTGAMQFFQSADRSTPDVPSASGSLLEPKEHLVHAPWVIFNKVITVPTITLDEWAERLGINHVDLLWLDMQGYELNVLKASPKILKAVKAIYTEVEFVEAYHDQYLYEDVKNFLEAEGFTLVARDAECPWFGNVIFVRK